VGVLYGDVGLGAVLPEGRDSDRTVVRRAAPEHVKQPELTAIQAKGGGGGRRGGKSKIKNQNARMDKPHGLKVRYTHVGLWIPAPCLRRGRLRRNDREGGGHCAVLREAAIRIVQNYAGAARVSNSARTDGNTSKGWWGWEVGS
jgi:hypothetical protein